MEISELIGKTLKKPPAKDFIDSFKLFVRGGFIKVLEDNSFVYGTCMNYSMEKLYDHLFANFIDYSVISFRPMFTHERLIGYLNNEVDSYKQLPIRIICRSETANKNSNLKLGLLNPQILEKLYIIKLYANLDTLEEDNTEYEKSLIQLMSSLGIEIENFDNNFNNQRKGNLNTQYAVLNSIGKDEFVICTNCDYKSTMETASEFKETQSEQPAIAVQEVHTPNTKTIADLALFLDIPESQTAKVVFYTYLDMAEKLKIALIIIRGDMEVNEYKIMKYLGVNELRVSTDEEIISIGCVPGFASAIGIERIRCTVVVDNLIVKSPNLVAGANKIDYHTLNTNYERDYQADIVGDISKVTEKSRCYKCRSDLEIKFGISVASVGSYYDLEEIPYLDQKGKPHKPSLRSLELDVTRIFGLLGLNSDKYGVLLPPAISPFEFVLLTVGTEENLQSIADRIYTDLKPHFSVLYDNRAVKLGVKLADADLRAISYRIIISDKLIVNDQVELSIRGSKDKILLATDSLIKELNKFRYNPATYVLGQ